MKKANIGYSNHHILARSHGGATTPDNIIELKLKTHRAIHLLFGNENLGEKIKVLLGVEYTALKESVKAKLLKVLDEIGDKDSDWYKQNTFK